MNLSELYNTLYNLNSNFKLEYSKEFEFSSPTFMKRIKNPKGLRPYESKYYIHLATRHINQILKPCKNTFKDSGPTIATVLLENNPHFYVFKKMVEAPRQFQELACKECKWAYSSFIRIKNTGFANLSPAEETALYKTYVNTCSWVYGDIIFIVNHMNINTELYSPVVL